MAHFFNLYCRKIHDAFSGWILKNHVPHKLNHIEKMMKNIILTYICSMDHHVTLLSVIIDSHKISFVICSLNLP